MFNVLLLVLFAHVVVASVDRYSKEVTQPSNLPFRITNPCKDGSDGLYGWLFPPDSSLQIWTSFQMGAHLTISIIKNLEITDDGHSLAYDLVSKEGEGTVMPGDTFASTVWGGYLKSSHTTKWTLWRLTAAGALQQSSDELKVLVRLDCSGSGPRLANSGAYHQDNPFMNAFDNDAEIKEAINQGHFLTVGYGLLRQYGMMEMKMTSLGVPRPLGFHIFKALPYLSWSWACNSPAKRAVLAVTDADGLLTFPVEDQPGLWKTLPRNAVRVSVISHDAANDSPECGVRIDWNASLLETLLHCYEDLVWICVAVLLFKRFSDHKSKYWMLLGGIYAAAFGMQEFYSVEAMIIFSLRLLIAGWTSVALDGLIYLLASIFLLADKLFRWSKWPLSAPSASFKFILSVGYFLVQALLIGWLKSSDFCILIAGIATLFASFRWSQSPLERASEMVSRILGLGPKILQAGILIRGIILAREAEIPITRTFFKSDFDSWWITVYIVCSLIDVLGYRRLRYSKLTTLVGAVILWLLRPFGLYSLLYLECFTSLTGLTGWLMRPKEKLKIN